MMQTSVTAAGECLINTTLTECASAWCDENRVERDVDYDGPLAQVTGSWNADVPDAQVASSPNVVLCLFSCTFRLPVQVFDINGNVTVY